MGPVKLFLSNVSAEVWVRECCASELDTNSVMDLLKNNPVKLVNCRILEGMDPVRALPSAVGKEG